MKCELWAQAGSHNWNVKNWKYLLKKLKCTYWKQDATLITATIKAEHLWHHWLEQWCFFTLSSESNSDYVPQLIQTFKVPVLDPSVEHEFVLEYPSWIDFFFSCFFISYINYSHLFACLLCLNSAQVKGLVLMNTLQAFPILTN